MIRLEPASRLPRVPVWAAIVVVAWIGGVGAITLLADRAADASGGRYAVHRDNDAATLIPLEVETDGWYQLALTARGVHAGGAWPSIALAVDDPVLQRTAARVVDHRFRRTWHLYLAGSEAAFRTGLLQLFQVTFAPHGSNAIPWTRAGLYQRKAGSSWNAPTS